MFTNELDAEQAPEILRSSLTSVVLTLKSLGVHNFADFDFVDAPAPEAIAKAMDTLLLLGAVSLTGQLCRTGRMMAELPLEPGLAKMLLHAELELKCGKQAAAAVAVLSLANSIFFIPREKRAAADGVLARFFRGTTGDVTGYAQVFAAWEAERCSKDWAASNFLNYVNAVRAREVRNQLVSTLTGLCGTEQISSETDVRRLDDALSKCFIAGFFMNAAVLTPDMVSYSVPKSQVTNAMIHPASCFYPVMQRRSAQQQALAADDAASVKGRFRNVDPDTGKAPLIVFGEMRSLANNGALVSHVVAVEEQWLREAAPPTYFKKTDLASTFSAAKEAAARRRPRVDDGVAFP